MFGKSSYLGLIATGFCKNIWSGPAAVIVFFVISGFCIHYPLAGTLARPYLPEFYVRRFLRLLIPITVAIPLSGVIGVSLGLFSGTILWSLLCELIYYLIYPALRVTQVRCRSWTPVIVGAYVAAFILVLTRSNSDGYNGNYASYGSALNWVLGLPCWILGCALAESVREDLVLKIPVRRIWSWRIGVLGSAWVCSALRYHAQIAFPWTLDLFAVVVSAWLFREIALRRTSFPTLWLERAGLWSYSLYLMHPAATELFRRVVPHFQNTWLRWGAQFGFVLIFCYVFYCVVERPSHGIARIASKWILTLRRKTELNPGVANGSYDERTTVSGESL
jgi:peptidoglycan/LPS O-acetylase OafA/YrhL